jgi:DNA-directed RNA polymerase specialized sigma24 family protein
MKPEEAWEQTKGMAARFAIGRGFKAHSDDLQDFMTDVYLKIHQNIHRFNPQFRITTFVWYLCMSAMKEKSRTDSKKPSDLPLLDCAGYTPFDGVDDRIVAGELVSAALAGASAEERFAFAAIVLGVPRAEAAAVAGQSEAWMHEMISRWRKRLNGQFELGDAGEDNEGEGLPPEGEGGVRGSRGEGAEASDLRDAPHPSAAEAEG